jgi:hypothetical protein
MKPFKPAGVDYVIRLLPEYSPPDFLQPRYRKVEIQQQAMRIAC